MSEYSDQEIDLRPYISAVFSKWYWILGLGLLAGILASGATSYLTTPTYEATALVSITEPRQRVQFDPRIVTVEENQPLKAYPEIAISDELLTTLQTELPAGSVGSMQHLRSLIKATPGSDPRLLRLTVRNSNPETATTIANIWAELFVSWANRVYGDSGEEQLIFFEQRLADSEKDLQNAEQALVDHQALNRSAILENKLEALTQNQSDMLAKLGEIELLSQDIESLLALFQDNAVDGNPTAAADQFTLLILKLRAFGGVAGQLEDTLPWQIQVNAGDLETIESFSQEEHVQSIKEALAVQASLVETALAKLEPEILATQQERQEADAVESLMQRNIILAEDTHTALARTVEEKRITSQDNNAGVRLASRSTTPTSPMGSRKITIALAATLGIIFLVVLIIVLFTWWGSNESSASAPASEVGSNEEQPTKADCESTPK